MLDGYDEWLWRSADRHLSEGARDMDVTGKTEVTCWRPVPSTSANLDAHYLVLTCAVRVARGEVLAALVVESEEGWEHIVGHNLVLTREEEEEALAKVEEANGGEEPDAHDWLGDR